VPDFMGGLTTPFLAAFDPDGSKTDKLLGRGSAGAGAGRGRVGGDPDPDEHPGFQNGACLKHPEGCGLGGGGGAPIQGGGPIQTSGGNDYPPPEHQQFFWESEEDADARWEAQNPGWQYNGGYPTRGGGGDAEDGRPGAGTGR
jgi:hypothetical protein